MIAIKIIGLQRLKSRVEIIKAIQDLAKAHGKNIKIFCINAEVLPKKVEGALPIEEALIELRVTGFSDGLAGSLVEHDPFNFMAIKEAAKELGIILHRFF